MESLTGGQPQLNVLHDGSEYTIALQPMAMLPPRSRYYPDVASSVTVSL